MRHVSLGIKRGRVYSSTLVLEVNKLYTLGKPLGQSFRNTASRLFLCFVALRLDVTRFPSSTFEVLNRVTIIERVRPAGLVRGRSTPATLRSSKTSN